MIAKDQRSKIKSAPRSIYSPPPYRNPTTARDSRRPSPPMQDTEMGTFKFHGYYRIIDETVSFDELKIWNKKKQSNIPVSLAPQQIKPNHRIADLYRSSH